MTLNFAICKLKSTGSKTCIATILFIIVAYGIFSIIVYSTSLHHSLVRHDDNSPDDADSDDLQHELLAPWTDRFSRRPPLLNLPRDKNVKKKSRFLVECPADFVQAVHRDQMLGTHLYLPSTALNYTQLRSYFWHHIVASQSVQYNQSRVLNTVQSEEAAGHGLLQIASAPAPKTSNCSYRGRVFGVGMYKTGTTSLSLALNFLGYVDNYKTSIYKWLPAYVCNYSHWFLILRHYYDYMHSVCTIHDGQILLDVLSRSQRSFNFGDVPSLFFWPLFDRWYPHSKFILTKRKTTAKFVNSVMKFCVQLQECMNWVFYDDVNDRSSQKRRKDGILMKLYRYFLRKQPPHVLLNFEQIESYNWTQFTLNEYKWHEFDEVNGHDIAHYIAMIYELHNQRVVRYFETHDRMNDLLIVNIDDYDDESMWKVIMDFLGCENDKLPHTKYPHVNPTKKAFVQIQLIPDDYVLDWQTYFNHSIPIMMTTHTPVKKIWFEFQKGDYQQLI